MTGKKLTVQEIADYCSRRDCADETFMGLKCHPVLDQTCATAEESMHGRGVSGLLSRYFMSCCSAKQFLSDLLTEKVLLFLS